MGISLLCSDPFGLPWIQDSPSWTWLCFHGISKQGNYFQTRRMMGDLLEEVAFEWSHEGWMKCKLLQANGEKRQQCMRKHATVRKHKACAGHINAVNTVGL